MQSDDEEKYIFLAKWFDGVAQLDRQFFLIYFLADGSVELYDRKARTVFLKRTVCDTVQEPDLYVGNAISVFSRKLRLITCLNEEQNITLQRNSERTVIIMRGEAKRTAGRLLDAAFAQCLRLVGLTEKRMTNNIVALLSSAGCCHREWQPLSSLVGASVLLLDILGLESLRKTAAILEKLSSDATENDCILYQTSPAIRHLFLDEYNTLFGCQDTTLMNANNNYTCCLVKPHAIKEGLAGKIIVDIVNAEFEIAFIQLVYMDVQQSESFLEVYNGVVSEYHDMVSQLNSGPLLVMAICGQADVVTTFRKCVGPVDPKIGKHIRPTTLRAKYGKNRVLNAVHCTDLIEDGQKEVKFFLTRQFQRSQPYS